MERSPPSQLLSWLLVPVAAVLVQSALSLPRQGYTGVVLSNERVWAVVPDSPGEQAGLRPGDRVLEAAPGPRPSSGPLGNAEPGRPLVRAIERGGERRPLWLVPDPLPDSERWMRAALLLVASGFVLLGGWVWSERRDALARTFFLMCLAFAWLVKPLPSWDSPALAWMHEVVLIGVSLVLPALCVHFFVLFPESRVQGRLSTVVRIAYAVAGVLFALALFAAFFDMLGLEEPRNLDSFVQTAAAIWFAIGLGGALAIFFTSYRRAASGDARRRLRVALLGTAVGLGPLAAMIALRNLLPGVALPGERGAVLLTLFVPASLAWATVVHRIFDFRVALRAGIGILVLAIIGALAWVLGEWLAGSWWPAGGAGLAGGALAFVAAAAAFAGPVAPWLGTLGSKVVPGEDEHTLADWTEEVAASAGSPVAGHDRDEFGPAAASLLAATAAIERFLRLDGCLALVPDPRGARVVAPPRPNALDEPDPALAGRIAALRPGGVRAVGEADLDDTDRAALESAGVRWLLPVGSAPVRAVLLLGRRLAGPWLSRREAQELERLAERLAVRLENAALRREASTHGALERELREAGAIQAHLLPRRAPILPTLDCAAAALSSEPVGGDYYDFIESGGRDFTLAVGDAAGKGVPAALILAQVQARFRPLARMGMSPGGILGALNTELVQLDQPEKFMGLLCAHVDVRRARVRFANAGLTPPLVYRAATRRCEQVLAGGLLLGVSAGATHPDATVELGAGDVVVVYTDGLTEARRGEDLFGLERVEEVVRRAAHRRAADLLGELVDAVRQFADRPLDDLTIVILRQLTHPATTLRPGSQIALKEAPVPADSKR